MFKRREYFTGANMLLLAAMGVAAAAQVKIVSDVDQIIVLFKRMSASTRDWLSGS